MNNNNQINQLFKNSWNYNYLLNSNYLQFAKSGIKIKKSHKGKFTEYCGGKVTEECINKGKNSPDPSVCKLATFAKNARAWKHQEGGNLIKFLSFKPQNYNEEHHINLDNSIDIEAPVPPAVLPPENPEPQKRGIPLTRRYTLRYYNLNTPDEQNDVVVPYAPGQEPSDEISERMLTNLYGAEGFQNGMAIVHSKFGENFATGPFGMVYKWDAQGNNLGRFREGEQISREDAIQNAKNYYNRTYREWKNLLNGLDGVTQERLEALVSLSGGTTASKHNLMKFVKSHWGDWDAIDNKLRNHAHTDQSGKVLPGLVLRSQFAADWFKGIIKPFSWYQLNRNLYNV